MYNVQGQFQFKKKLSWPTNSPQREPRAYPINKEVANIKVKNKLPWASNWSQLFTSSWSLCNCQLSKLLNSLALICPVIAPVSLHMELVGRWGNSNLWAQPPLKASSVLHQLGHISGGQGWYCLGPPLLPFEFLVLARCLPSPLNFIISVGQQCLYFAVGEGSPSLWILALDSPLPSPA